MPHYCIADTYASSCAWFTLVDTMKQHVLYGLRAVIRKSLKGGTTLNSQIFIQLHFYLHIIYMHFIVNV